ncbi:MAG: PSD1 and planctomycete cytochrome C domain-containing protein [Fuerstiella sp.]
MVYAVLTGLCCPAAAQEPPIDFNRDIRPLLSDRCFHCHGPDPGTREADLRLDQEAAAKDSVLVAGSAADSELIRRILATDPDEVMPPPASGKSLNAEERALLTRWVNTGAVWANHWSFEPPVRPPLPEVRQTSWPQNPIDYFVLAQLEEQGLQPSPEAEPNTLLRRVAFDLTGLPPTPQLAARFLNPESPHTWQTVVDELLGSEHYGERMAMVWLDAARYADSDGYQADATRQNWPWRDWVIDAYNSNMPFDQFTIEQFAGDLLPDTDEQHILATCFHRNHMHNGEGGRDPEESRVEYVMDRVNTVGTVWLGLTLGCAQCHSHKYDPITQAEYYQLNAFFNSIDENGKAGGGAGPFLKVRSPYVAAGLQDSEVWLQQKESELQQIREEELAGFETWLTARRQAIVSAEGRHSSWSGCSADRMVTTGGTALKQVDRVFQVSGNDPRHDDYLITLSPPLSRLTGLRLKVLPSPAAGGQLSRFTDGHIILTNLKVRLRSADGTRERDLTISEAVADYQAAGSGRIYGPVSTVLDDDPRTGWMTTGSDPTVSKTAAFVFDQPVVPAEGESLVVELRQRSLRGHSNLQRFTLEFTDEAGPAARSLDRTPLEQLADQQSSEGSQITDELRQQLQAQFLADRARLQAAEENVARARRRRSQYDAAGKPQSVTVLKQRDKPRDTHVLVRGIWNHRGDPVSANLPAAITAEGVTAQDRLQLAQWLVSRSNPLTARVTVNRYWQMYFGHGLVRTPDDFGTQGEPPTHPELLDWLAVEFMESGWDIKQIQRLIVTSATYRQSSEIPATLLQRDPENRLLARATRFRLPSWMLRDAALASSGLLAERVGGPPVFPFQPEGAWLDATMGRFRYEPSVGADRYRRSLYTFWRRSVGPTGMFDASKRRVCEVRSVRTNTPLQALTLMNDETFVEAARQLAAAVISLPDDRSQITTLSQRILLRNPSSEELKILQHQLQQHRQEFTADPKAAVQLLTVGQTRVETSEPKELAALAMLATTLLNLDEAITHE